MCVRGTRCVVDFQSYRSLFSCPSFTPRFLLTTSCDSNSLCVGQDEGHGGARNHPPGAAPGEDHQSSRECLDFRRSEGEQVTFLDTYHHVTQPRFEQSEFLLSFPNDEATCNVDPLS